MAWSNSPMVSWLKPSLSHARECRESFATALLKSAIAGSNQRFQVALLPTNVPFGTTSRTARS